LDKLAEIKKDDYVPSDRVIFLTILLNAKLKKSSHRTYSTVEGQRRESKKWSFASKFPNGMEEGLRIFGCSMLEDKEERGASGSK
jgi:hypothetical protein